MKYRYIIEDVAEENVGYIKEGVVTKREFMQLLLAEIEAYVDAMQEDFSTEVNGVRFTVRGEKD